MTAFRTDQWTAGDAYEAYMGRWSRPLARAHGEAGYERARQVTWDGVIERLVGA